MTKPKQDKRVGKFETPLGPDKLVLARMTADEALGEMFEIVVDCLSDQKWIDFTSALGVNCSLTFETYKGAKRHFNGVLVEARTLGPSTDFFRYELVLRPWLWLLTKRNNSRIFAEMKVDEIIKKVFSDAGQTDFEDKLVKQYPKLEYCVQYRETDFAFVSRLMELHGIYYYFRHTDSKHTLVLADDKSSHEATPLGTIKFIPPGGREYRDVQKLNEWHGKRQFYTNKVVLNEYNHLKASSSMKAEAAGSAGFAHSDYEHYEYPGRYDERSDGETYAKIRAQMEEGQDKRRKGAGDAATLMAGQTVKIDGHYEDSQNTEYLILRSTHSFEAEAYRSSGGRSEHDFATTLEFLESKTPYRSPFRTPKPRIFGVQTAKVVGKDGEEIDVDEHGRIQVEFYWERDKKPSRRVRVAHLFAGKNWGGIHTPRVGMEAVVEFLEGDPDRPLVIGTVYNSDNKHPYPLPAEKTKSGMKTNSSKGGGGFNEFRFEDKKDSEEVFFHAQKDLNSVILNQETRKIAEKFGSGTARKTEIVNGDDDLKVANGNYKKEVSKNREAKIGQNDTLKVGQNQTITIGMDVEIKVGKSITLTCGPNKITIDPGGIKISGPTIALTAPKVDIN